MPQIVNAYNCPRHKTTFYLLYGCYPCLPVDFLFDLTEKKKTGLQGDMLKSEQ